MVSTITPARHGRRRAAWAAFAVAAVLTATLIRLETLTGADAAVEVAAVAVLVMANATVGLLVALRRSHSPIGWLLAAHACAIALVYVAFPYAYYDLVAQRGALPGARWAALVSGTFPLFFAGAVAIGFVFPDGRLVSPRWRPVAAGALVSFAGLIVLGLFRRGGLGEPFERVPSPLPELPAVLVPLLVLFMLGTLASLFAAAWAVRTRLRRAAGVKRLQLLWLAYAALGVPLTMVVCLVEGLATGTVGAATAFSFALTMVAIPVAIGIAILRHGLLDIELVLNRTLVYGTLTVGIVGVYVAIVAGAGRLVDQRGAAGLIAAGLIAVAVQPLRAWLQRRVDHLVYGYRSDPYAALRRLGERLRATLAPDEVLATIVESTAEALRLPYVAIELARGEIHAAHGSPGHDVARVPLRHQGETVGWLVLAVPAGRELVAADRRLLEDLASQAGVAVHAIRLTADLQRSRERLISAREEERRRQRRDLHDGLGPTLAGAVFVLDAARERIPVDPAAAARVLERLRAQMQDAIAEVRRLVDELRPPALDELGLVGALREHALRLAGDGDGGGRMQVAVSAPERLPTLPAAVEVAAYRIAMEAITNVARHASATRCQVDLTLNGGLDVEVSDDGDGLPAERHAGVGLHSMRERADELGGSLTVTSRPGGGTRVRARLPIESP